MEEPVVFLLGWEGSKDEELMVYSRLYESLGCITVRYSSQARFLYTATSETTNITTRQVLPPTTITFLTANTTSFINPTDTTLSYKGRPAFMT